jgi:hypothetical protein
VGQEEQMPSTTLLEIERQIHQLQPDEQLWLIERLVHGLRRHSLQEQAALEKDLAAMAADPQIQSELRQINEEFLTTESDGLEGL